VLVPSFLSHVQDRVLAQAKIIAPTADMLARWLSLPPAWQSTFRTEAQRAEQLCEEQIKIRISRLRVLLLLYRFT
jgi:hypothetical protein